MLFNSEIISDTDNTGSTMLLFALLWFNIHLVFYTESCFIKTLCIHLKLIRTKIAVVDLERRQESLSTILVSFNWWVVNIDKASRETTAYLKLFAAMVFCELTRLESLQFKYIQHTEYNFSVHELAGLDWTKMEYSNLQ